jgi:DNA-binding response OmpR family regulator
MRRMKALVVEDDRRLGHFLCRVLAEEGFAADLCTSGAKATTQAQAGVYHLMLLDWMLPDLDGLSVCRGVRQRGLPLPILMLTARGELSERVLGLETGADDYLVKPFEVVELIARVHALMRRTSPARVSQIGELTIDPWSHRIALNGQPLELSSREYSFLLHLAHSGDKPVSRSELLQQIWDIQFDPGSNLMEVLVSRLRDKLGAYSWMIETVRGVGYRLREVRAA